MKNISIPSEKLDKIEELLGENLVSIVLVGSVINPYLDAQEDDYWILVKYDDAYVLPNDVRDAINLLEPGKIVFEHVHQTSKKCFHFGEAHFDKTLRGEVIEQPDILSDKLQFLKRLRHDVRLLPDISVNYHSKIWYHVYMDLCFLESDSYALSEEQIAFVNHLYKDRLGDILNDIHAVQDKLFRPWPIENGPIKE